MLKLLLVHYAPDCETYDVGEGGERKAESVSSERVGRDSMSERDGLP